ncbi:MAG: DUF2523 family protein [Burkholderiales bacterium]
MPLLVAELLGGLAVVMGSLMGRALLALGLSFITFAGVQTLINTIATSVQSSTSGLGGTILGLVGYLWIDRGISMVLSAWTSAVSMKLVGGAVTGLVRGAVSK